MKTIVLLFCSILLLTSCVTYQYLTINQQTPPPQNKEVIPAADSLQIDYGFTGYNALLNLNIKNKSSKPIIINWKKSSLITNGQAISLYNSNAAITTSGVAENQNSTTIYSYAIGNLSLPEGADFIPPLSAITKKTIYAIVNPVNISFQKKDKVFIANNENFAEKFIGKNFEYGNSPYKIRVYITYQKDNGMESIFENEFYVSEILFSTKSPVAIESFFTNIRPVIYL